MKTMLGISTCWWDKRSVPGDRIIEEALDLGLEAVELEYRLSDLQFQQMKPLLNHSIKVCSLHNIFPKPQRLLAEQSSGDIFFLSAIDRDERQKAIDYTMRTIQYAHELEVPAVVLHLGGVDIPGSIDRFRRLKEEGLIFKAEGRRFVEEEQEQRKVYAGPHFEAVLFSLDRLNRAAEKLGVLLGIENRYYFQEIPNFEEIGSILREFDGGAIRYWHDVGHAQAHEVLGICRQKDFLEFYAPKAAGVHIHDAKGLDDHIPPGEGEIDLNGVLDYFNPSHTKVMEINYKVERERLEKGIEFTRQLLSQNP